MNKYCRNCWGTGKVPDFWDNDKEIICPHCSGTGIEPPMTNEEWRKTCSAEEFIKWIVGICNLAVLESTYDVAQLRKKRYWEIWLEEEHVEGVGGSNNDDA